MISFFCKEKGIVTNIECAKCFAKNGELKSQFFTRVLCKFENVIDEIEKFESLKRNVAVENIKLTFNYGN